MLYTQKYREEKCFRDKSVAHLQWNGGKHKCSGGDIFDGNETPRNSSVYIQQSLAAMFGCCC